MIPACSVPPSFPAPVTRLDSREANAYELSIACEASTLRCRRVMETIEPYALMMRKGDRAFREHVDQALAKWGKIDILINGAAGNFLASAEKLSYNAFKTVLEIDTMGTFNVSKIVFQKSMKE